MNRKEKGQPIYSTSVAINNLLFYLNTQLALSDAFNDTIKPMLAEKPINKCKIVASTGEICLTAFWIDKGYARIFVRGVDKEGLPIEITIGFCGPGKILVLPECFFGGSPSEFFVEIAEESLVIPFTRELFDRLKLNAPEAEALANRILALIHAEGIRNREIMKLRPRARHHKFLEYFGREIAQYFSGKDIASYLGLHPKHLSRILGEIKPKTAKRSADN